MLKSKLVKSLLSRTFQDKSYSKFLSTQVQELKWDEAKPYDAIPGPKNLFDVIRLVGPGGKYKNIPYTKLMEHFREDYGPIVKFPGVFGLPPMVISFDAEDIEKVFRAEGKYPTRIALDSILYFRKTHRPDLFPVGAGLVVTQNEEWHEFRSKVQQVFMHPQATKMYIPGVDEVACEFVEIIRRIRDSNSETPENFLSRMNEWGLESISLIALDARLGLLENPGSSRMNQLMKDLFQALFDYDIQPSIWRIYKTPGFKRVMLTYTEITETVNKYVMEAIERFEKNPTPPDQEPGVLEKLTRIDRNVGITMAQDMLQAGIDTTSSTMISILYCLAKNPDKQEILRKEVLQVLPEKDSKITASAMRNLPYLRAVVKEALRMHPLTVGNFRGAGQDIVLHGHQVPKGMNVLMCNGVISKDEHNFKESKKFIPERWLRNNNDPQCPHAKDAHPFTYLPFGFGFRMCIGRRFAELQMEILTMRILRNFRLEWNHEDLKFKSITINLPDGPLRFKMVEI